MKVLKNIGLPALILLFGFISFAQDKKSAEIRIKTSAVCGMCKERIEKGLAFEKGIRDVNLDLETKIATVVYNPAKTSPSEIRKIISKLGHDADTIPADSIAYRKLPACCKKEVGSH